MTSAPRSEAEIRERLALINTTIDNPPKALKSSGVMLLAAADALQWVLDEHDKQESSSSLQAALGALEAPVKQPTVKPVQAKLSYEYNVEDAEPMISLLGPDELMVPTDLVVTLIDGVFHEAELWGPQLNKAGKRLKQHTRLRYRAADLESGPGALYVAPAWLRRIISSVDPEVKP